MSLLWVAAVWSLLSILTAAFACVVFHGGQGAGAPSRTGGPDRRNDADLSGAEPQPL